MERFFSLFIEFWHEFVIGLHVVLSVWVTVHAALKKKNTRAALGWIGLVWLSPIFGAVLYYVFGINRVNRKALKLNKKEFLLKKLEGGHIALSPEKAKTPELKNRAGMFIVGDRLNLSPFFEDTQINVYKECEKAIDSMINEVDSAKTSVTCLSYIFDDDEVGARFVEAFSKAVSRGVEVRVLVDHVGSIGPRQNILHKLKKKNVVCTSFLPISSLFSGPYANLRNHRKLLIIDGEVAFTGGMNISARHLSKFGNQSVKDLHFKLRGHVVRPLQRVFMDDWHFAAGEVLEEELFLPTLNTSCNQCAARVIPDAPGEGMERIIWQFKYAIESAKNNVKIMTPYFLPTVPLASALKSAALRGVEVEIITPSDPDHKLVNYALMGSISDAIKSGVKFYFSNPPFNHSKLFLVDDDYVSIGSTNWDPRSLELNFELNVEIVSKAFSKIMNEIFEAEKNNTALMTYKMLNSRNILVKLRDGFTRLFTPYL